MNLTRNHIYLGVAILVVIVFIIWWRRRKSENYESVDADVSEITALANSDGKLKLVTFDGSLEYEIKIKQDADTIILVGFNDDGTQHYISMTDAGEVEQTTPDMPVGNYRYKLKKALNGDAGFYSLNIAGTEKYVVLDPVTPFVGIADLSVDGTFEKMPNQKGANVKFVRM